MEVQIMILVLLVSLIPVMSPDYVADEMMDAILMHQKYCVLPWYLAGSIGLNA